MSGGAVALEGALDFARVPELLREHRGSDAAAFDLSGVTRVDSAGLALLLELQRSSAASGGLRFEKAPEQLRKLAEFFDLSELLQLS